MRNHFMRFSGFSVMAAVAFGIMTDASAANTAPVGGGSTRAGFDGEYFANTSFSGKPAFFACDNRVSLGDWWGLPNLENGMTVYNESNRALMLTPWKNPHPEKPIKSVTMESTSKAIPALFGITAGETLASTRF
jgi:hypothetical protein